jgi:hypothetical protein
MRVIEMAVFALERVIYLTTPLNFALHDMIGMKLNDIHQLLVYADDVNIFGGSVHAIKKSTEALVVASKETGLEVNAEKTKYLVMS